MVLYKIEVINVVDNTVQSRQGQTNNYNHSNWFDVGEYTALRCQMIERSF